MKLKWFGSSAQTTPPRSNALALPGPIEQGKDWGWGLEKGKEGSKYIPSCRKK